MMIANQYSEYKESNIQWLGKIPKEWTKFNKIKHNVLILEKSKIEASQGNEEGKYPFFTSSQNQSKFIDTYLFDKECLILSTGGSAGIHYYNGKFSVSTDCLVLRKEGKYHMKYLYYWLNSNQDVIDYLGFWGMGLRHLQKEFLFNLELYFPSDIEQIQITNYLDKKTANIDKTIEKDKELIKLLEEKRISLINYKVLLDKNLSNFKRLKFNVDVNPGGKSIVTNPLQDVSFLPMEKVSEKGEIDLESKRQYFEVSTGFTSFRNNDVIVAKITPCFENGKGALVDNLINGFGFGSTEFHVLRAKENISSKFIFYLTNSHKFRIVGEAFMSGSAGQKRVSTDFIKDFIIPTPSIQEQTKIADYLDVQTANIDKTIKRIENRIELLEEYKKSLIHHIVTGKVKVEA